MKKGDVILEIAGQAVKTTRELRTVLGGFADGDKTTLLLQRSEERLELEVSFTGR